MWTTFTGQVLTNTRGVWACALGRYHARSLTNKYINLQAGGSLRSPPACTCVCLHVLLNLVRHMVWNSLCIPCMDSSLTMSRWSIIQSKTLYHVVVGSLFDCNFRGYRSAWQLRPPFTWFLEHAIEHAHLWHPVLSTLLNQSTVKKLVISLANSLARLEKARANPRNLLPRWWSLGQYLLTNQAP